MAAAIRTEEDLVNYDLCDTSGNVFSLRVSRKEAGRFDIDPGHCFRTLRKLKENNVKPKGHWGDLSGIGPIGPCATSSPIPGRVKDGQDTRPPRATGKKGGVWPKEATKYLFEVILSKPIAMRLALRKARPTIDVYEEISTALYEKDSKLLNYSADQIKEKLRNLKRAFQESKSGSRNIQWEWYLDMNEVFDVSLDASGDNSKDAVTNTSTGSESHVPVRPPQVHGNESADLLTEDRNVVVGASNELYELVNNNAGDAMSNTYTITRLQPGELFNVDENQSPKACKELSVLLSNNNGGVMSNTYTISKPPKGPGEPTHVPEVQSPDLPALQDMSISEHVSGAEENLDLGHDAFLMEDDAFLVEDDAFLMVNDDGTVVEEPPTQPPILSPVKKKTKKGGCEKGIPRTPPKPTTPRTTPRKVSGQCNAVWPDDATELFLKQCVLHKENVQGENAAVETWKVIADFLGANGHELHWKQCQARFQYLNLFFSGTMLPNNGTLGGVKWKYYEYFLDIHDLPRDYLVTVLPPVNRQPANGTTLWDHENILLLISLYKERYPIFKSKSLIRHATLYAEIAGTINLFEVPVSADQCKRKVKELEGRFREEYDRKRKTGSGPSTWEYFDVMMDIYDGNASIEPEYSFSCGGNTTNYTHKGNSINREDRNSRARPPAPGKNSKGVQREKKPPIFQSSTAQLQVRAVSAKEDIVSEVGQMRSQMFESSQQRLALMSSLVASVAKIASRGEGSSGGRGSQ